MGRCMGLSVWGGNVYGWESLGSEGAELESFGVG